MQRSATSRRPSRLVLPKPYHLVRDRKGRRVILCAIGNCVHAFSEIHTRWRISKRRKFKRLMDRALEFAEKRTAITGNSTYAQLEFQVRIAYRMWKQHEKERTLVTLSANLKDTLLTKYHLTEEQAVLQGGSDDES
ncbi:hypothetical protein R1sor_002699 [Riccia sorocarpa]|uniref:Uncharacterized protein n=1 Tax=Riccia sorocarpa TaxID=122646 RepID=A0ABD3GZJ5_9MARC